MEDFEIHETTDIPSALCLDIFVLLAVPCMAVLCVSCGVCTPKVQISCGIQAFSDLRTPL